MASWMVHLRVADELFAHLNGLDETAFVMGNLAPDSGVPNADWSEFRPPYSETHFKTKTDAGEQIDADSFRGRYLNDEVVCGYSLREYSFFLGYYVHLLTDIRWSKTVYEPLKEEYPREYAEDKRRLIQTAKEDWYDLDFLYLEQHPDFRAFSVYEKAAGFDNEFMEMFSRDAFDNRRRYICGFYRSQEHGELHRDYHYLTQERSAAFVKDCSQWILSSAAIDPARRGSRLEDPADQLGL